MLTDPNNRPYPIPPNAMIQQPQTQGISIQDIISIRIALDQIREPSTDMKTSIANLDRVINLFTTSFNFNQGPAK